MFIETNPLLLAVTFIVSLLHSAFDFLAFKNDIHFWKGRKNFEGLSVRSVIANTVIQLVVLLYLCDNSSDTSYMILVSSFIGVLIEFWKVTQVVNISLYRVESIIPYMVVIKQKSTYTETKTMEHDIVLNIINHRTPSDI